MGQTASLPERIHRAAKANDVPELQSLCQELRRSGADRQALNWTDLEGRTALNWAAARNSLAVAQLLLQEGADVHLVAPKRASGGSALAEAVAGRHEAMVELLLRHGADPFTENSSGKTPLDVALELRHVAILRSLERYALFAGVVNMKVLQMKGFSHAAKDRWVVVAPRFTPPSARSSAIGVVRVTMLIFRNAAEAEPRTKVWLDGAHIFRSGNDAILRLHPNHEQPRNAFTKFDHGWMLFFKQAAAASNAGGDAARNAAATFAAFMVICSRPLEQLQQQQQLRAAGAPCPVDALSSHLAAGAVSAANPWQQQGQQQPGQQQQQQPQHAAWPPAHLVSAPNAFAGNAGGTLSQPQQQQAARPYPAPQQQQQHQQAFFNAGVQLQAAAAPPAAAQGAVDAGALQAGPGESDEEFARRLAAMLGGSGSNSEPRATGSGTTTASAGSRTGSQTAAAAAARPPPPQSPPAAAATGGGGLYPALPVVEPPQGDASAAPSAPMAPAPSGSTGQQQQQQAFSDNPFRAGGTQPADAAASTQQPQQHAAAPVAAGATGGSAASVAGPDADADVNMCVICLSNQREVGLLHGTSVHMCLCKGCAPMVEVGSPCPMCRGRVERVIGVF